MFPQLLLPLLLLAAPALAESTPRIGLQTVGAVDKDARCAWLLHPLGADRNYWSSHAEALKARGWRGVAVDLPAHGQSAPLPRPWRYAQAAKAVLPALRSACAEPGLVLGASSGGMVALVLAALPDGPRAPLVLVGAGNAFDADDVQQLARQAEGVHQRATLPGVNPARAVAMQRVAEVLEDLASYGPGLVADLPTAKAVTNPVLLVHGGLDTFFAPTEAAALAAALPAGSYWPLPSADHLGPLADPTFWPRVLEFVEDAAPATRTTAQSE